jgi:alcohol dehydrogenase
VPLYEMRKFVVPEFIFGVGARHRVGYYARNLRARKILIVSDPGVIQAGWVDDVEAALNDVGIGHVLFHDVTPNPRHHEVRAGARFYAEERCDVIVAVGGGSVMDCAKGIGIVHSNGRDIRDFEGVDRVEIPGPPLICIPTTAGTAAEISQFCLIKDQERLTKFAIISKSMLPDVALIDPQTTTTMPRHLAACTGIDALTHALEALVSTASSPMADVHALAAIELCWNNIERAVTHPEDFSALENMMLGSLHAGMAFSNASLGAVHALAHSLGGLEDLPHGECNALVLSHVIRFNLNASPDRYDQVARLIGIDMHNTTAHQRGELIASKLAELGERVGIAAKLSDLGVRTVDVPQLASRAMHDACLVTNPRKANIDDIKTIYGEAL